MEREEFKRLKGNINPEAWDSCTGLPFWGCASESKVMLTVSGRTMYDACGRVVKAYYPTVCDTTLKFAFSREFDRTRPTVTAYDVLDRPVEVTLPDGSVTSTSYGLDAPMNAAVTEVTDALGNVSRVYADGSGNTLKTVRLGGDRGEITTSFGYDALDRLVRVTDTEGNVTESVYDMGGRRTEVVHPASGRTTFTYDAAGNMLSRQTAELAASGAAITYGYDFSLLTSVSYPGHPENDVRFVYGNRYAPQGRKGRLILREDGSGATEYTYGPRGEVICERRTFSVPGQAVATYVTEMEYDSHGRLLSMTYPDNERVSYGYDAGGMLESVTGSKLYGTGEEGNDDSYGMTYNYVDRIGYDRFGQRTYVGYGNGTRTFYTYDDRRRMSGMSVKSGGAVTVTDNTYTFDAVGNVLSLVSGATAPAGCPGGVMTNTYVYDELYRLSRANGSFAGTPPQGAPPGASTASYQLSMTYDDMHRVVAKRQEITQNGIAFDGVLNAGYRLGYSYSAESPFGLDTVTDANYRTVSEPSSGDYSDRHTYTYDRNGNLTGEFTDRATLDLGKSRRASERRLAWDEENRLTAVCDNGYVSAYLYDADGERVFKASGDATHMYVDAAEASGGVTDTRSFTLYVSPYLVVGEDGRYTKHFYAGAQRVVSKVGDRASYGSDPRTVDRAGNDYDSRLRVDYAAKKAALEGAIATQYEKFGVPFRGMDHDNRTDAPQRSFADPAEYERQQYFYHPDHLGSTSYVTDADGNVAQHVEYVPFGEVLVDQRATDWSAPYLFNAKELDEETGLYYYGARYYNPRLCLWLSPDPLQEKYPEITSYAFVANNPLNNIDYDGYDIVQINNEGRVAKVILNKSDDIIVQFPNSTRASFSSIKFGSTPWEWLTGGNSNNRQIMANIFSYYAKKVGVTGVGVQSDNKGFDNIPAYFGIA